ncbi:MAG: hypothetical protein RXO22_05745 [Thermocladium sp.]
MNKYLLALIAAMLLTPVVIHASYVATVIINQQNQQSLIFSVSQVEPITVPSGNNGVVTFQVPITYAGPYYLGGAAITFNACGGAAVVSQNPINIGWISPGQTIDLDFEVNTSIPMNCGGSILISWSGLYKYNASSQSYYEAEGSGSASISITEYAIGSPLLSASINSTQLPLLANTPIRVTLKNNGSGPIYDLLVTTQASGAFINGSFSDSIYYKELEPGKAASFLLWVKPTTGQASITIIASGINAFNQPYSTSYQQYLTVTPLPPSLQSLVNLSINSTEIIQGRSNAVTLLVTAVGHPLNDFQLTINPLNMYVNGSSFPLIINIGKLNERVIHLSLMPLSQDAELSISYSGVNAAGQQVTGTGNTIFTVIQEPTALSVSLSPSTVYAGNPTSFKLSVTDNSSLILNNVTVTVISSTPLINSTYPPILTINKMMPGQVRYINLSLIPSAATQFSVQYSYVVGSSVVSGSLSMAPLVKQPPQLVIWTNNGTLGDGDNHIVINIYNPSNLHIRNVALSINQYVGLTIMGPTTYEVGSIGPNQVINVSIPVLVPVTSQSASISYSLTYETSAGPGSIQGNLAFSVVSPSQVVISSIIISPNPPGAGSPLTLSLTFINTGFNAIYNVNASVSSDMTPISQQSTFYGELSPQTPTAGAFTFQANKPGRYFINLTITYMDGYGKQHEVSKYITVYVTNYTAIMGSSPTKSRGFGFGGGFGAAAIGIAILIIAVMVLLIMVNRRAVKRK